MQASGNRDDEGFRALHYAGLNGHVGFVDALLRSGCDITAIAGQRTWDGIVGMGGTTCLMMAISNGHTEVAARLLQQPGAAALLEVVSDNSLYITSSGTPFLLACNNHGQRGAVGAARQRGVQHDTDQSSGSRTGLHAVIMNAGQYRELRSSVPAALSMAPRLEDSDPAKVLAWLLQQDDIPQMLEVRDAAGRTPLQCAIEQGETECVALLGNRQGAGGCGVTEQPLEPEPEPERRSLAQSGAACGLHDSAMSALNSTVATDGDLWCKNTIDVDTVSSNLVDTRAKKTQSN
jgi:ankyrin repeat protein